MARFEARSWYGNPEGETRADREPCRYDVYLPDQLGGRRFTLEGDVAADVGDAEVALARLDRSAHALTDSTALDRMLLRAEAVASSRIEGLEVGGGRLLRAEAAHDPGEDARDLGEENSDGTALEVIGNIEAMTSAVDAVPPGGAISLEILLESHRRLLSGTGLDAYGGQVRTMQNWIGISGYSPCAADFVPPPPELVDGLLADLIDFCNDDGLSPVTQAAVAHAQFETIHPFVDGNGRAGRILIQLVLRRRGLAPRILPPVSLSLASRRRDYIHALAETRYEGAPDGAAASSGVNDWISLFAGACRRAASDAGRFEAELGALQASWTQRLGGVRR